MRNKQNRIDTSITWLLLIVLAGIVVHAPLTVGLSTLWPEYELLIKSWKEVLLLVAALLMAWQLTRQNQWKWLLSQRVVQLVAAIAVLDSALVLGLSYTPRSELGGLLIDLRYYLYFGLVHVQLQRFAHLRKAFLTVFFGGAALVAVLSLLQVFVLPKDSLSVIGYSDSTIKPYLTVDLNPDYVRINSTLRGPNPLGAYAVIVLSCLAALALKRQLPKRRYQWWLATITTLGMVVSLWWSYSRSALVGAVLAAVVLLGASYRRRYVTRHTVAIILGLVLLIVASVGVVATIKPTAIANVVFHTNTEGGSATTSDEGHLGSLEHGIKGVLTAPFGHGVGSSGSASLLGDSPVIIENQYLTTAWQSGLIGLLLSLWLFAEVLLMAWRRRQDAVALAVVASGVALAVIGLVLPVWTDDTVSIVWWGLAAIALSVPPGQTERKTRKGKRHDATRHKKAN